MIPSVTRSEDNGTFRLVVQGKLDSDASLTLVRLMAPHSNDITHDIVLDLKNVTYIGSECVGVLISFGSKIRSAGRVMKVTVGSGIVESVLSVCGFFKMHEKLPCV